MKFPPLNPLRFFEVAARSESFTEAARELCVTPSAVSRQIGVLEEYFNAKLFHREQGINSLTPAGRRLRREISPAFESIGWVTDRLLSETNPYSVTIQTYPTFSSKWLLPRLARLLAAEPKLVVNVRGAIRPNDFTSAQGVLSIRCGVAAPEDFSSFRVLQDRIVPACSPACFEASGRDPMHLLTNARLLISKYRRRDWSDWARAAHLDLGLKRTIDFDSSLQAYNAAVQGIGVMIGQCALIDDDIDDGRLVLPFATALSRDLWYWCAWPRHRRLNKGERLVLDWLRSLVEPGL